MTQLDMFAESEPPPPETITAWMKMPRSLRGAAPLPTLIQINGDDHHYAPVKVTLTPGCRVGQWPSRDRCVLGPSGERMTLYDAVNARLATITREK